MQITFKTQTLLNHYKLFLIKGCGRLRYVRGDGDLWTITADIFVSLSQVERQQKGWFFFTQQIFSDTSYTESSDPLQGNL
jgi:hypothetical protein